MLVIEYMKVGEFGPFEYRLMNYDSVTHAFIPVDLTNCTVTFNLFEITQDPDDGTFTEEGFATDIPCEVINESDGWISAPFTSSMTDTERFFRIEFPVSSATFKRVYPRIEDQKIRVRI